MDNEAQEKCPSTTNAIEHRNTGCKQKQPIPLKMAMINLYRLDEAVSASTLLHEWCKYFPQGQGSKRYDVQLVKLPVFQLLGKSKSV